MITVNWYILAQVELVLVHRYEWSAESAREQVDCLRAGIRDHRIADDTINAIEIISGKTAPAGGAV